MQNLPVIRLLRRQNSIEQFQLILHSEYNRNACTSKLILSSHRTGTVLRWRKSADNQRRENTVYIFYFDQLFFTRRAFRNLSSILLYDFTVLSYKTTLSEENICTSSSFFPNYTSGKVTGMYFSLAN